MEKESRANEDSTTPHFTPGDKVCWLDWAHKPHKSATATKRCEGTYDEASNGMSYVIERPSNRRVFIPTDLLSLQETADAD